MEKKVEQPNYYAIIPASVRYDNRLKANEKLLYSEITALSNKSGYCYATNKYFGELYEVDNLTISRWIKHLKELGYIDTEIIYKENSKEIDKRIIKINGIPIDKNVSTYIPENQETSIQNSQGGIDEKVKENNTSINNTRMNNITTTITTKYLNIKLIEFVESAFGRTLNGIECEVIETWEDTDLTRYAVKQAVLNGAYRVKYIASILVSYKQDNIKTIIEAQEQERKFKENKAGNKSYKTITEKSREVLARARERIAKGEVE